MLYFDQGRWPRLAIAWRGSVEPGRRRM